MEPTEIKQSSQLAPYNKIKLFYSYSHKDMDVQAQLETHLTLLKRLRIISTWYDRKILPGQEWRNEIDTNLEEADIILLLISADFLASDYCYEKEMKRALERHESGEACVIPVIIRDVDWRGAPFAKLQVLPEYGKPVNKWSDDDEAWTNVSQGIRKVIETIKVRKLIAKFNTIIEICPPHARKELENIRRDIETLFENTFTYPKRRFGPVFGEAHISVFSPFGKTRYPVVFEFPTYERASCYEIAVNGTGWSIKTKKRKIEITSDQLSLIWGEEYMWTVKLRKGAEVLEEEYGFFSLLTLKEKEDIEQIENQIIYIESENERLLFWGAILEEKELYIDAIQKYKKLYNLQPSPEIAYRIACCYNKLELADLRDEWNRKILQMEYPDLLEIH